MIFIGREYWEGTPERSSGPSSDLEKYRELLEKRRNLL